MRDANAPADPQAKDQQTGHRRPDKTPPERIAAEVRSAWAQACRRRALPPDGWDELPALLAEIAAEPHAGASAHLQPWATLFDFGLQWIAQLHVNLTEPELRTPRTRELLAPWALSGAACHFGLAIRRTVEGGFDVPARCLLRSYTETLLLCLAASADPALAERYRDAQTEAQIREFWVVEGARTRLEHRIDAIEETVGREARHVVELVAWRQEQRALLAEAPHLSYLAAASILVVPSADDPERLQTGIFGRASAASHRTLSFATRAAWHFSRYAWPLLFQPAPGRSPPLAFKADDSGHTRLLAAREALNELVLRHWAD